MQDNLGSGSGALDQLAVARTRGRYGQACLQSRNPQGCWPCLWYCHANSTAIMRSVMQACHCTTLSAAGPVMDRTKPTAGRRQKPDDRDTDVHLCARIWTRRIVVVWRPRSPNCFDARRVSRPAQMADRTRVFACAVAVYAGCRVPKRCNWPPTQGGRLRGTTGGLIAGLLFVIPGAMLIALLAWGYVVFGQLSWVQARLSRGQSRGHFRCSPSPVSYEPKGAKRGAPIMHWQRGAFIALFAFGLPFPIIIAAAGAWGYLTSKTENSPSVALGHRPRHAVFNTLLLWGQLVACACRVGLGLGPRVLDANRSLLFQTGGCHISAAPMQCWPICPKPSYRTLDGSPQVK